MKNDLQDNEYIFLEELKDLPDDQYCCPDCDNSPEILKLNFNDDTILIKCPQKKKKREKIYPIIQYFLDETKYHYIKKKCDICYENKDILREQYNCLTDLFKFCSKCNKNLCKECYERHNIIHSKNFLSFINEKNTKSNKGPIYYNRYCLKCDMHLCEKDSHDIGDQDSIRYLSKQKNDIESYIEKLKHKKLNLICFIKLIDSITKTFKDHSTNYFHILNIINISKNVNSMYKYINKDNCHILKNNIKKSYNKNSPSKKIQNYNININSKTYINNNSNIKNKNINQIISNNEKNNIINNSKDNSEEQLKELSSKF